jgi:hypothetical protein
MHDSILSSFRDTLLFGIPCLGFLVFGIFRLDEILATPKEALKRRRAPCGLDEDGKPLLSDPDGRLWGAPRLRQ